MRNQYEIMAHFNAAASSLGSLEKNSIFIPSSPLFEKKLKKALPSGTEYGEYVLFIYDDTVFGGAKEGTVMTNKKIYYKELMDIQRSVALDDIHSFRIAKNSYGHQLYAKTYVDGEIKCLNMMNNNCQSVIRFKEIVDLITEMINYICGKNFQKCKNSSSQEIYNIRANSSQNELRAVSSEPAAPSMFGNTRSNTISSPFSEEAESCFKEGMNCYSGGQMREALLKITRAADLGMVLAMCRLGNFYNYGRGVPKDIHKALDWYKRAAALGSEEGKTMAARISAQLAGGGSTDSSKREAEEREKREKAARETREKEQREKEAKQRQLEMLTRALRQRGEQTSGSPYNDVQKVPDPYSGGNGGSQYLMRCGSCGAEWNPGKNSSVMNMCPFCGSPLKNEKDKSGSSDEMAVAISNIVKDYGRNIIRENGRFSAMFSDYAPKLRQEKKMIEIALGERIADIILDDMLDKEMKCTKIRNRMADSLIREDAVERLIQCFAIAYNW